MKVRAFLLGLTLGMVFASVPSCAPPTKRCLRSNCNGCCDENQDCQGGTTNVACGCEGRSCAICMQGQACTAGLCVGGNTGGGASGGSTTGGGTSGGTAGGMPACPNCNGCCDNGACRGGNTFTACGRGGATCENCQAQNKACNNMGQCIAYTCPGCLLDGGQCAPGSSNLACGSDAGICQQCGSNQTCFNGTCVTATTCGPANCGGCCDGTMCIQTPTTMRCGSGGNPCITCNAGETCTSGTCLSGAGGGASGGSAAGGSAAGGSPVGGGIALPCSLVTCASGCCDAQGVCQPGTSNSACGLGGRTCRMYGIACTPLGCI